MPRLSVLEAACLFGAVASELMEWERRGAVSADEQLSLIEWLQISREILARVMVLRSASRAAAVKT